MSITISPSRVARFLVCVVLTIVVVGVAAEWVEQATQHWSHKGVSVLAGKFVLDGELSIPAWYSSLSLFACSSLLGLIAWSKHRARSAFARHWFGLSAIFLVLSIDEMTGVHEMCIEPLRRHFGASGIFHYAWVIPASVFVAGFAVAYMRFVFVHLDVQTRWRFLTAGVMFVGAALGLEFAEGPIDQAFGLHSLPAEAAVTIEEAFEMFGIVVFLFSLLCYIRQQVGALRISIEPLAAAAIAIDADLVVPNSRADATGAVVREILA